MASNPEKIGPYTLDREIGRGGMGVVYLGLDTRLDRPVAIKALPEHLASDPERMSRFRREAKFGSSRKSAPQRGAEKLAQANSTSMLGTERLFKE